MLIPTMTEIDYGLMNALFAQAPMMTSYLDNLIDQEVTPEIANLFTTIVLYTNVTNAWCVCFKQVYK